MPNQDLLEKLKQLASASRVFKLMAESDQAVMLDSFERASDSQITEAIKAIQAEDQKLAVKEQEQLERAQKQVELAEQLHAGIKSAEHQLLVSEEHDEQENNAQVLANMEDQLNATKSK